MHAFATSNVEGPVWLACMDEGKDAEDYNMFLLMDQMRELREREM